ncbi:putative bifunctional diguanylate cyclase/phosphodiesterase [Loktanella sp. R86503]|uniref:putative bifunctional diguanylate cyclase/phosphodiesterase n=1 Tax=Loktanella sp. R86503 TaxID=3093847 RepID=UPI0036DC4F89
MLDRLKDRFILETQLTAHIVRRDRLSRMSVIPVVCAILAYCEDYRSAAIIAATVTISEAAAYLAGAGVGIDAPPPPLRRCAAIWTVAIVTTAIYMAAGALFGAGATTAAVICACIWMFGALVHVSNSFVAVPIYNWSMLLPSYIIVAVVISNLFARSFAPPDPMDAITVGGLLLVYFANSVQTTQTHKDSISAYENMRELAARRLIELKDLSLRDTLTRLPNRRAFDDLASNILRGDGHRHGASGALFLINLDGFKPINDSYGHAAGDALLKEVARRLTAESIGAGAVARLGGDEFAMAWPGPLNTSELHSISDMIQSHLHQPMRHNHRKLQITASIGIAPAHDGASVDQLLNEADQAMFHAKNNLESRIVIYDRHIIPKRSNLNDRARLLSAMQQGEICPFYQPQVDIATNRIIGLEALARWMQPKGKPRTPGSFLPAINEVNLQAEFQDHMLQAVLKDMTTLQNLNLLPDQVSINLSEVTLATAAGRDGLLDVVGRHPNLSGHLMFEVTEDIFIARAGQTIKDSISMLRMAGVRISLDDFGTGFATFQHLQELEFDELKLDTGFVSRLGTDRATDVLVKSFLDMGRGLDVRIVAEGVETTAQLDILRDMGCQTVQGYLFSPALSLDDTSAFLQAGDATVAA